MLEDFSEALLRQACSVARPGASEGVPGTGGLGACLPRALGLILSWR